MSTDINKKYAVYLFGPPNNLRLNFDTNWQPFDSKDKHFIDFSESVFFEKWEPKNRFENTEDHIWKDWLGSLFWDEMIKEDGVVSLVCLGDIDSKDHELTNRIHIAFNSFRIAYPFRPPAHYRSKILIGEYRGDKHDYTILSINSVQNQISYIDPFYAQNSTKEQSQWYYGNFHREEVLKEVAKFFERTDYCIKEFKKYCIENECESRLNHDRSQVEKSIYAFNKALKNRHVSYVIPCFIRGLDCLLALKPGEGQIVFADRIIDFLCDETFENPFYQEFSLKSDLIDLYRLRNDCVHGRNWDYNFQEKYKRMMTKEELARFSFIAEDILRRFIKKFLFSDELIQNTFSRALIEEFWATK